MTQDDNTQYTPGRTAPCCISMAWAFQCQYIKKGYLWRREGKPFWMPWSLKVSGPGWIETSPIHFCPFCGTNLDKPEE